jgi:hypothetical protein
MAIICEQIRHATSVVLIVPLRRRGFGLQPHRSETFKLSPDPLLVEKVRDIVGLYMNPPDHALVFCVDEKSQIVRRDSAVKLVDVLAGVSPAGANCPVGTVVISGDGAGDQTVGSPEVKALDGWMQIWSAPTGGQAKQQVVAQANRSQASKTHSSPESECEEVGNAETFIPS